MGVETTNLFPAVFLGITIALTLILLPRLNDESLRRRDEPPPEGAKDTKKSDDMATR